VVWDDGAQILADSDGRFKGNPFFQDRLGCDTWAHALELPIRLNQLEVTGRARLHVVQILDSDAS